MLFTHSTPTANYGVRQNTGRSGSRHGRICHLACFILFLTSSNAFLDPVKRGWDPLWRYTILTGVMERVHQQPVAQTTAPCINDVTVQTLERFQSKFVTEWLHQSNRQTTGQRRHRRISQLKLGGTPPHPLLSYSFTLPYRFPTSHLPSLQPLPSPFP